MGNRNPLFATKSVDECRADAEHGGGLKRTLSGSDLVLLGIGAIIAPASRAHRRPPPPTPAGCGTLVTSRDRLGFPPLLRRDGLVIQSRQRLHYSTPQASGAMDHRLG